MESLWLTLKSLSKQTLTPKKIVIIDQSSIPIFKLDGKEFQILKGLITYINTYPAVGLVQSKRKAVELALDDPICFIEDDVVLDPDFLKELSKSFAEIPNALGVGGICRNSLAKNPVYAFVHKIFYRGVFLDSRPWITLQEGLESGPPIPSTVLSGGISAWRRKVLTTVPYVPEEGFHMMEDMHFSRKVIERFGPCLWINPQAKLQHFPAQEGRARLGEFEKRRIEEALRFYRYHQKGISDTLSFFWLAFGLAIFSIAKSIIHLSCRPILGHLQGVFCCCLKKRESNKN